MNIPEGFKPVPEHDKFFGKLLFENAGEIINVQLAVVEPGGGGPVSDTHTHEHNHLFAVLEGECLIKTGDKEFILKENETALVNGGIPHSTWNKTDKPIKMLGICVKNKD